MSNKMKKNNIKISYTFFCFSMLIIIAVVNLVRGRIRLVGFDIIRYHAPEICFLVVCALLLTKWKFKNYAISVIYAYLCYGIIKDVIYMVKTFKHYYNPYNFALELVFYVMYLGFAIYAIIQLVSGKAKPFNYKIMIFIMLILFGCFVYTAFREVQTYQLELDNMIILLSSPFWNRIMEIFTLIGLYCTPNAVYRTEDVATPPSWFVICSVAVVCAQLFGFNPLLIFVATVIMYLLYMAAKTGFGDISTGTVWKIWIMLVFVVAFIFSCTMVSNDSSSRFDNVFQKDPNTWTESEKDYVNDFVEWFDENN